MDVLYAWIPYTGDHQWIYGTTDPHPVLSVDHTPFFPGGPDWTTDSLRAGAAAVVRDPVVSSLDIQPDDRRSALDALKRVDEKNLAEVVAHPRVEWGISQSDRVAVATYLFERRSLVLALFEEDSN